MIHIKAQGNGQPIIDLKLQHQAQEKNHTETA